MINLETYHTYNYEEFYQLMNEMPLVPIVLLVSSVFRENPLDMYEKKLSVNFNLMLVVRIQIDGNLVESNTFYIRDKLF